MLRFRQLLNIVLFDLGYRTIRFGISYYTILNIVLYDFGYRTIRFRERLSGVAQTRVMGWGEASCNLQTTPHVAQGMQMDVCGGDKCHTCRWGGALAVMWPAVVFNHLIHSEMRLFCETFSMLLHWFFRGQ